VTERSPRYPAPPADGLDVTWTTWDGDHAETLTVRWDNEAWTATGRVEREAVEYVIRLSPLWSVSQFLLFRDLDQPDLWLGTDGRGRWGEVNGAHRPDLDGAVDVALACTPFTLSLPVRRLPLRVGDRVELPVLDIDVETLGVVPTTVAYERLDEQRWRVSESGTTIEFDVDAHGLPLDVEGRFRRRSGSDPDRPDDAS
jgi:hypothetical protein